MTTQSPDARLLRALRCDPAALAGMPDLRRRIEALRAVGYEIAEATPGEFQIVDEPPHLIADDLAAGLPEDALIGREIVVFRETDSTNDVVARAGRDGVPEGFTVFAETQRAGRGRLGREWSSASGAGLWFSILLRPTAPPDRWPELTFCAALAVAQTAEACTGLSARVKWPNDVMLQGKKVAGILLESHHPGESGFVVMGIGLNVLHEEGDFAPELRAKAASLSMLAGKRLSRRAVGIDLLNALNRVYARWPSDGSRIMEECTSRVQAEPTL